ncbi:hypothetical protein J3B02_003612, partial [Coemansia erecta]
TSSSPTETSANGSSNGDSKISSGVIAGIVIACLVLVVIAVVTFMFWRRHRQKTLYAGKGDDYSEFPEFNPSVSNNGLPGDTSAAGTPAGYPHYYYSDKDLEPAAGGVVVVPVHYPADGVVHITAADHHPALYAATTAAGEPVYYAPVDPNVHYAQVDPNTRYAQVDPNTHYADDDPNAHYAADTGVPPSQQAPRNRQ